MALLIIYQMLDKATKRLDILAKLLLFRKGVTQMSTNPSAFRLTNAKRAIKGAEMAGLAVGRVDIDPKTGVISIVPKRPDDKPAKPEFTPGKKLREWNE